MNEKIKPISTDSYKGVRDFYPEEQFIQNHIFGIWKKTSESFGYQEYNASILEHSEIYKEKSGEEIVNEQTFTFIDRGGREVTLRPEMTPTVARMIASKRRELGFPLRWYSIPNLFRYEAPQRGRLREHWQLNVDLFGINTIDADIEIISLADSLMKNFGAKPADYEIRINSSSSNKEDLNKVIEALEKLDITNFRIDETLARGQAYYTGVVFEFFDTDKANPRSILGGGRYDNLTELFGEKELPAVGFGAGDVTIRDFLETHNLLPSYKPSTDCVILTLDEKSNDFGRLLANKLRENGINTSIDPTDRKIGDKIRHAEKNKISFIMVIGEDEMRTEVYKAKNIVTGEEVSGSLEDIIKEIKTK